MARSYVWVRKFLSMFFFMGCSCSIDTWWDSCPLLSLAIFVPDSNSAFDSSLSPWESLPWSTFNVDVSLMLLPHLAILLILLHLTNLIVITLILLWPFPWVSDVHIVSMKHFIKILPKSFMNPNSLKPLPTHIFFSLPRFFSSVYGNNIHSANQASICSLFHSILFSSHKYCLNTYLYLEALAIMRAVCASHKHTVPKGL